MCTILIVNQVAAELPLIIAANRDEFYARPATGPQVIHAPTSTTPRAIAGIDAALGGTWMGATETGLFVGLTNQRTFLPADRDLRSRGEVVAEALRCHSVAEVRAFLEPLDGCQYNPFNLLYGDGRTIELARARPGVTDLTFAPVPPGIHVLPNDDLDAPHFPKVARAKALLGDPKSLATLDWPALQRRLTEVLADHQLPAAAQVAAPPPGSWLTRDVLIQLQALCIHTEVYGTCSATIAAVRPGGVAHYLYAAGAPCREAFEDVTGLLTG